jgi:penicillin amidase
LENKKKKFPIKTFFLSLGGLVLIVGTVLGFAFYWLSTSLPRTAGEIVLGGINGPVEIVRDRRGVPHISATNQFDAAFALGFVHAQDRLWQMESMRYIGAGRLSEIVGRKGLRLDRFMRTLGIYRLAEAQYKTLSLPVRRTLNAYARGVNAWIEKRRDSLPIEFVFLGHTPKPWKPADSLVWAKIMGLKLSGNFSDELLRAQLAGILNAEQIRQLWPENSGKGRASDAWAVAGKRTLSGKPLLANDPHLGFSVPVTWYLADIKSPGFTAAGATVPGLPFVILGHNKNIAWGMTSTQSDLQDIFIERPDPNDSSRYLTPEGSEPFKTRREVIKIEGGGEETLNVRETRHGPVISDISGLGLKKQIMALSATFLKPGDKTPEAFFKLNRAGNWAEFLDAMKDFQAPQENFVYADKAGNIGFIAPGLVPIRKSGRGRVPMPGWTGEADWTGYVPFDALPRTFNPPSGRIVAANNRIIPPGYPYFITDDWAPGYRARRIKSLLDAGKQSLASSASIQNDITSLMVRELKPLMLKGMAGKSGHEKVLGQLRAWDGKMDRKRPEPLIFAAWVREFGRAVYADELKSLFPRYWDYRVSFLVSVLSKESQWCDDVGTAEKETCGSRLALSLDKALKDLAERFGSNRGKWTWGVAHQARFRHPLFSSVKVLGSLTGLAIAADGGQFTLNRGAGHLANPANPFEDIHGPGLRAIYDLSDLGRSLFIIATGQSGNPLSPHYKDMLKDWRDGKYFVIGKPSQEKTLRLIPASSVP